ncbi:hypothetical protein Pmar_PMAR025332 [Perkinsus marinus ATCC 50983]|uniref:CFAP65 fourth Ig-like domain-containing protein n=1 Tax=Perkinsus marinus (strain ATCC 50983 / TXsc) TaxID=423536 RepID=C5KS08_PERM5|nr:hypothetical protein Pmar_PMAR025332 [Perkinsus marinus ATCC 50983]EER12699.1 hypothetical protein Pmar_PMAR025332 [Perkinsus marinus ATCC 50983]|eukprot:XP_002780904.1 hypothetical protein Pmar_PMAR025332 [Perkinsus marinus ATCC 50983]
MSAKSLTFEEVEVGTRCTKVFHIINYSPDVTTQYQVVQTRCNDVGEGVAYSVLELDNHCGVIEPRSTATVVVTARPEIPYNHYRRLWVLVRHAAEPLYVDCIVNSFNADHHPMKLTYAHVKLWRAITSADLSSFPPPNSNDNKLPPSVALDDSEGPSNGWEELVKATGLVSERAVTFGACSPANGPYLRKISVNNPSPGRVMVYWPSRNATCKPAFEIRPGSGEIPGSNTREFTIEYHPPTEGDCRYTVASMDCVMVPKENRSANYESLERNFSCRSYRFGDAAMLVPPHTSTIVATAHSWPSERHAEPKVTVNSATKESTSVRFRGVTPGQTDAQVS